MTVGRVPAWVRGGISDADAAFLTDVIRDRAPRRVLEVGIGAGTSSAAILAALDGLGPRARELWSVDVSPTCWFDPRRQTGSAAAIMYPTPRAIWRRQIPAGARWFAENWPPGSADLGFVDANHYHPWATFDVVHLAQVLPPGAWIVLHDVALPDVHPQFQQHGPMWLFDAWPFPKRRGDGDARNIGAIELPADRDDLADVVPDVLARPWETKVLARDIPDVDDWTRRWKHKRPPRS